MAMTTIAADYGYLNSEQQESKGEVNKLFVVYHGRKPEEWGGTRLSINGKYDGTPGKRLARETEEMGYLGSRIIMKGDQEPALQDMLRDAGRQRGPGAETILLCSPVRGNRKQIELWKGQ